MRIEERFERALHSQEPLKALNNLALELSAEGRGETDIYNLFENFILYLRNGGEKKDAEEELLMEAMDALTGWCHPSAQIKLPVYLEPDVADFVRSYARRKNMQTDAVVNEWLHHSISAAA